MFNLGSSGEGVAIPLRRNSTFDICLGAMLCNDIVDPRLLRPATAAVLLLSSLMPANTFTLSPTLATPISFSPAMSRSNNTRPSISFAANISAKWAHLSPASHVSISCPDQSRGWAGTALVALPAPALCPGTKRDPDRGRDEREVALPTPLRWAYK